MTLVRAGQGRNIKGVMGNKLFIYGTLTKPEIQKGIFGRVVNGTSDALYGYEKSKIEIDGGTYPIIIPNKNGKVPGLVIEISDDELKRTDEYETEAYQRINVILESGISAWVYIKR